MTNKIAFLDVDGCVANFIKGACLLHGRPNPYLDPKNHGNYYVEKIWGMTSENFFSGMDENFWANLEPLPDWIEIIEAVEKTFGLENVCLLTAPTNNEGCLEGKRRWIHRWLPQYKRQYLIGPPKHFCAGPNKILVDDSDSNIHKFVEAGGTGVLLPRPWNCRFKECGVSPADFLIL